MTKVTMIEHDGSVRDLDLEDGFSLMEGAVRNGVSGIEADCGGACACATCHVYVDEAWIDRVGLPSSMEEEMLGIAASQVTSTSRLSCQITVRAEFDGLVVRLPASQR